MSPDGTAQVLWQKQITPPAILTPSSENNDIILTWFDEDLFSEYGYLIGEIGGDSKVLATEGQMELTFKLTPTSGEHNLKIYGSDDDNVDTLDTLIYDGMITAP